MTVVLALPGWTGYLCEVNRIETYDDDGVAVEVVARCGSTRAVTR
jgi:hypothetical protein